jgi:hypothetical protein
LGGILRDNSGEVEVEQIEPKKSSPVGFSRVLVEMSKGVIKERLEDEVE